MEPFTGAATIASIGKEVATAAEALETFLRESSVAEKGEFLIQQLDTIRNTTFESLKAQVDGVKANAGGVARQEAVHTQAAVQVSNEPVSASEIPNRELEDLGRTYNDEVRRCSAGGRVESTDVRDWKKVSLEESRQLYKEYLEKREQIIKEWESVNGQEWPRYEKDVIDPNTGKTLARAGDRFDAHHVQPREFGGKNTADNITPIHVLNHRDHMGIHRIDGPYHELAIRLRSA